MKYKLKDVDFESKDILYSLNSNNGTINGHSNCKLVNFTYLGEPMEFQTPKVLIEKIIKENNKEYLLLKMLPTEACRTFCKKILELENRHNLEFSK